MKSSLTFVACFFLASTAAAWTEVRNFNNGVIGEKVDFDAGGDSVYDDAHVLEGNMSARLTSTRGETGYGSWGGAIPHPANLVQGDELWFRVNTYFPAGFDYHGTGEGYRLKFMRFHTLSATGKNYGYNDIQIDRKDSDNSFVYIYEGDSKSWLVMAEKHHLPKYDVWETYEYYVKFHSKAKDDGGEAVIRLWKNGVLLKEETGRKTLYDSSAEVPRTLLFTYWNGGAPATQSMWVDDIVLTSDTPTSTDAHGNPYVGSGVSTQPPPQLSLPLPPTDIGLE